MKSNLGLRVLLVLFLLSVSQRISPENESSSTQERVFPAKTFYMVDKMGNLGLVATLEVPENYPLLPITGETEPSAEAINALLPSRIFDDLTEPLSFFAGVCRGPMRENVIAVQPL